MSPTLSIPSGRPWPSPDGSRMMKRAIDIVLSVSGVVALSPLWALIAVALKMDSAGPVLYAQARVGKGGRQFRIFKFRSIVAEGGRIRPPLVPRRRRRDI